MYRPGVLFFLAVLRLGAQAADADAQPPRWQERWDSYVERTYSWKQVGFVGVESAFDQLFQVKECARPPYCFPHHFGGALARRTSRTTIELAAGALLHEDIRRRPSGLTGLRQRVVFALIHAPLARGPHGEWRLAYSRLAGTAAATVVTTAWYGKPMTAGRLGEAFGWSVTNYFQDALLTEFEPDMKKFGNRVLRRTLVPFKNSFR